MPTTADRLEGPLARACAVLALLSVAPLLAWAYGLGSFAAWFWALSAPAMVALAAAGVRAARRAPSGRFRSAIVAGTIGGLVGTIGYDLFRAPFAAAGVRAMAPIDSYGVLLLGADGSSAWTGLAGWGYHFANGIGFGIAYALVAFGRKWWWGVAWAMVLETATVLTPFATTYRLRGHWDLIALAYAAHLCYGYPLGRIVERGGRLTTTALEVTRRPVAWTLAALSLGLVLWHRPFTPAPDVRTGRAVAPGASALVRGGRFQPEWLRVAPGGCATLLNADEVRYRIDAADGEPALSPGERAAVCFTKPGVSRVRTSAKPFSGGFVIVDREAA